MHISMHIPTEGNEIGGGKEKGQQKNVGQGNQGNGSWQGGNNKEDRIKL